MAITMVANPSNQAAKPRWADVDDDNDDYLLPPRKVIGPDANGIKKVIEYKLNHENKLVRVSKTYRVRKFVTNARKHVVERRAWRKFGDAVDEDVGVRLTMTSVEDVFLDRHMPYGSKGEEPKKSQSSQNEEGSGVLQVCRNCGRKGDHWTARCPYKDLNQPNESFPDTSDVTSVKDVKKGAYVPPSRRGGEKSKGSDMRRGTEENSVRVTNLSEDTREADLNELCSTFGPVTRTYVSNDQRTGTCRGFGFVNFVNRADAEKAIKVLNGYGYDNLILHVEWAAPRTK
ncbi:Eukaryotic translation initiation factor 3 subunit G [Heracleum sosnowskyi]|uniref:Eukaryotic translation initiation factor 3 subunit G n=1 Tax=Heracleum sosnowskyi TaxID=360622 RepID=A0AAD8GTY1_9APIA|nr:Eukaryotic translation initiation factor 3 subunit G [Heracleum sosnowskyi]